MKKAIFMFFALALTCSIHAQTTAATTAKSNSKTVTGTVTADAYQLGTAPEGMSNWVIDISGNDGKSYRNGISPTEAAQINNAHKNGKKTSVSIVRADGANDQITITIN